jgi:hypothetical protein
MKRQQQVPIDRLMAAMFKDAVLKGLDQGLRSSADASNTISWLVGLASTLLALAVASPERLTAVTGESYTLVTGLLLATVATGVCGRLVMLFATNRARVHALSLFGHFAGYLAGSDALEIDAPSDTWDIQEIARRYAKNFPHLDSKWLIEYQVPLERARAAYRKQYELHISSSPSASMDCKRPSEPTSDLTKQAPRISSRQAATRSVCAGRRGSSGAFQWQPESCVASRHLRSSVRCSWSLVA